jgi:hypothetical protein
MDNVYVKENLKELIVEKENAIMIAINMVNAINLLLNVNAILDIKVNIARKRNVRVLVKMVENVLTEYAFVKLDGVENIVNQVKINFIKSNNNFSRKLL